MMKSLYKKKAVENFNMLSKSSTKLFFVSFLNSIKKRKEVAEKKIFRGDW